MDSVLEQLRAAGLIVDQLEYGRIVRCKVEGDRGSKQSGWYVLHQIRLDRGDMVTVGRYGNYKRFSDESFKIEFDLPALSSDERARIERERIALREKAAAEKQSRALEAASRAHHLWENLPDNGRSDYLARKKVKGFGLRYSRGSVIVPLRKGDQLVGLQFIDADGGKKFLTGTAKQGAYHLIGEVVAGVRLWIAEGYATAATVYQATGDPVAVAFDAGNLLAVAEALRALHPVTPIVFAADDDSATEGNPGVTKAREAAVAVAGRVVIPVLDGKPGLDFNDVHVAKSLRAAREQLLAGFEVAAVEQAKQVQAADDSAPPLAPPWQIAALTIDKALERFALVMPDGKVWDSHTRQLLKKTVARDLITKPLFDEWLNHKDRRTTDKYVIEPQAKAAAAAGGAGLMRALDRYVYLYPTSEAWDSEKLQRVPLSSLKHAIADCYDVWIKSERRREIDVECLVFDPSQRCDPETHINTFRGLPLQPIPDSTKCTAICELMCHLCNNDPVIATWLYGWLAYPLQHVGAKMATAVLMHSHIQGSGKSLFFEEVIKPLYGDYGSTLGQHQLESQYTDWRSQLLFGLFEEIFSRDQKYSHTGTLKHMITGKTQRIEKKFVSGWEESNFMNAVFLSNEIQPFPVDPTDRRMLVVWPRKKMPADLKKRVLAEIHDGGVQAFYAFLLEFPLNGHGTHTEPPVTEEKERLVDFGRPSWEVFYLEWRAGVLQAPFMPCLVDQLFAVYSRWCVRRREHVVGQTKFSSFLAVQEGLTRRRDVHYDKGTDTAKGVFIVPREPAAPFGQEEHEKQSAWLGRCVQKFNEIVTPAGPPDMD